MEERIIDDEYGRGIRLKKTADGFVDVTDELAAEQGEEEQADEVSFEFPMMEGEEDDEDLVSLSPEEALALRQKKEEAARKRKEEYEKLCTEGEELLASGEFKGAEKKFEKALRLDELATAASVGYWRAKTDNFAKPDVLVEEYVDEDLESMEYDLGIDALDTIRREYREVFQSRIQALNEEEKPLVEKVESKQNSRREVLSVRLRSKITAFVAVCLPALAAVILTIVFGLKIPTTREDTFVMPTIILGGVSLVLVIASLFFLKKMLDAIRIYAKNERLSSSDEGKRIVQIREYKAMYEQLLEAIPNREQAEETEDDE